MPGLLKVTSTDTGFTDFYTALAWELGERGTVYTPYPNVPPNARMAIPVPTHVLVVPDSEEALAICRNVMQRHLARHENMTLRLESRGRALAVTARDLPAADELRRRLALD